MFIQLAVLAWRKSKSDKYEWQHPTTTGTKRGNFYKSIKLSPFTTISKEDQVKPTDFIDFVEGNYTFWPLKIKSKLFRGVHLIACGYVPPTLPPCISHGFSSHFLYFSTGRFSSLQKCFFFIFLYWYIKTKSTRYCKGSRV